MNQKPKVFRVTAMGFWRRGFFFIFILFTASGVALQAADSCPSSLRDIAAYLKNSRKPDHIKGAVAVILVKDGKVLLGLRKGSRGAGSWGFLGGWMEAGESPKQAAKREFSEEITLIKGPHFKMGRIKFLKVIQDHYQEQGLFLYTFLFMVEVQDADVAGKEPERADGWKFFDWEHLPQPLFEPNRILVESGFNPFNK